MAYLASNRGKFTVPADGVVDVRVELIGETTATTRVWLQCMPCGDELQDNGERLLFECPECGYEMTYKEAEALAQKHVDALRAKFSLKDPTPRRGVLWRFIGLFGSKKRLAAPKS
jgi:predicted RNA-binding Zn-ribbon protein involved in translation (DUF1610 family)